MVYTGKAHTATIVDLVTGKIVEANLNDLEQEDVERSVTAIVWSTGCSVYDRVPWLLEENSSRPIDWQDKVEPGSLIVLAENDNKIEVQDA